MKLPIKFPGIHLLAVLAVFACTKCNKMDMIDGATARVVVESDNFTNALAIPTILDGANAILTAQAGTAVLGSGIMVNALGYGSATILGPTIHIRQGEQFNLAFSNNLSEATNIHWHGLEVPAAQDGYPTDVTAPGGSFQYSFSVKNRPGTYWYHPHPDMATASQAYRGLAGFFLVSSPEEEALGLPTGGYDVPLVVQDKRLNGGLTYLPDMDDLSIGMFGESVLVNGTTGPVLEVASRTYRFRLLNGSNARIYNFALSTGAKFQLIGADGGLLEVPQEVSTILLAPGERADVLVNFGGLATGTELYLQSNAFQGTSTQGKQSFKILKFIVDRQETDNFTLPASLMPVEVLSASQSVASRKFNIGHMIEHGGMSGMVMHPLDGKTFDPNRRDEVVKSGTIEIWEFDNTNGTETHPMHLHAGQFQVLDRSGGRGTVQAWEKGWKDTALAFPGEKVRIIIRFPDNKGKFVFHCHNLEHEDGGMMLNYEIQ
ncbi:MAG: multicopper oxidase domain-containing protein [Saprospiraceae bacterium]